VNQTKDSINKWLFIFIAICSFIYVISKAFLLEITNDEAYSFLLVDTNYYKAMISTANTHWLNSIFMKLFSVLIGTKPWIIRLQSVLAFPLFAYYLYRFYLKLSQTSAKLTLISLFLINLFALEYFTLARGYGMCLAFLTASLFYSYKIIDSGNYNYSNYKKLLLFGILALASNYTVLFQLVGLFVIPLIYLAYKNKNINFIKSKRNRILFFIFSLAILTAVINLLIIKFISNDLQFGGDISFFGDTLDSIIQNVLYSRNREFTPNYFTIGSVVLFTFLIALLIIAIVKKNIKLIFFTSLFFFQFILNNIIFICFKTPFPFNRSALVLFPAIAFSFVFFIDLIKIRFNTIIGIIFISIFAAIFINKYSLKSSYEWPQQAEVEKALIEINTLSKQKNLIKPKILLSNSSYAVWINYYNHFYSDIYRFDGDVISMNNLSEIKEKNANFIITTKDLNIKDNPKLQNLTIIKTYPISGLKIYSINIP